jgi:hypothetical protein
MDTLNEKKPINPAMHANYIQTDGYSVHALFHNLSPHRRTGSHPESTNGHRMSYYKSRLKDSTRISLIDLTEVRPARSDDEGRNNNWKMKYGGRYNKAFHGIINAKHFFEHYGMRGPEEAKKVLAQHIFIAMDPGVINTVGMAYIAADLMLKGDVAQLMGKFVSSKLRSARLYEATTEADTKEFNRELRAFGSDFEELKKDNPRTADTAKIKECAKSYL